MTAIKKIVPTKWHRKPSGKHHNKCPYCGAPGRISGLHRRLPESGYSMLRKDGDELVEVVYERRVSNQKGKRHKYPKHSKRPTITAKITERIVKATQLIALGLTHKQVAERLETTPSRLFDTCTRHADLWKLHLDKATENSAGALKEIVGTSTIFENGGKLVRIAGERARLESKTLFKRPPSGKQTLMEFLEDFYLPSRIEISKTYAERLRTQVARFTAFFGKEVTIDQLAEADLCRYLTAMREVNCAVTVNKTRQLFLTLWKTAYDYDLCPRPPRLGLVRRVPEEVDPPEAWTFEECNRLFSAAAAMKGLVCGIPAGQWWLSLLLSIYWSSCRISAILGTQTADYNGAGILVRKQKNHRPQWYPLPHSCCGAIDTTNPQERPLVWPWDQDKRTLWCKMRTIVEHAGIRNPPGGRQLFHRIRRTSLSLCAAVDPSIAQRQAGHADYSTTLRHYVDPRIARGKSAADILPEPVISTAKPIAMPHERTKR